MPRKKDYSFLTNDWVIFVYLGWGTDEVLLLLLFDIITVVFSEKEWQY